MTLKSATLLLRNTFWVPQCSQRSRLSAGKSQAREIVDGQQRLTTLQVILIALRDVVHSQEEMDRGLSRTCDRLTQNDCNMEQAFEAYKVWPTTADQTVYETLASAGNAQRLEAQYPQKRIPYTQRYFPRPRLAEAYLYFYRSIVEYLGQVQGPGQEIAPLPDLQIPVARLDALADAVTKYMELVVIELEEDDNPQVIFETLNATGEPLLPSDLIRNFVFMEASRVSGDIAGLYQTYWRDFDEDSSRFWKEEERQGRLKRPRIDLFMFHFLVYKTGRELLITQLFQEFKQWWQPYVRNHSMEAGLKELQTYATLYKSFFEGTVAGRLGLFVNRLRVLDTSTVYPILLYLYGEEPNVVATDRERILSDLESYLVRRMVCQLTTKSYNRLFLTLLRALRKAERVDASLVGTFLADLSGDSGRWPTDQELEQAWLSYPSYLQLAQRRVVLVLEALDLQLETNRQEQLHITRPLSIEHVRPQHPSSRVGLAPVSELSLNSYLRQPYPPDPAAQRVRQQCAILREATCNCPAE